MQAVRLEAKMAQEVLAGRVSWLMSLAPDWPKGHVAILQSCSDLILGQIFVTDTLGQVSEEKMLENQHHLCQSDRDHLLAGTFSSGDYYVIVFREPSRYFSAVPYREVEKEIPLLNAA